VSTHTVNINGIDLVYEKEGSGPPLVLLHGSNASAAYWETVLPHLMGDYACFVLEFRGHGRSARAPDGDYTTAACASDVAGFLQKVTGPAILAGQSMGGFVALEVAALHPALVRAVYSEDAIPECLIPSVGESPLVQMFKGLEEVARRRVAENASVAQHAYNLGQFAPFGPKWIDVMPPARLAFFARHSYETDPAFYASVGEPDPSVLDSPSAVSALLKCPIHVAHGNPEIGGIVPQESLDAFKAACGQVTATYFPNAGHEPAFAVPREYINDLKAFLAKVPA
jgi:pimeloyl-ACP methyl ester carboxylesterase